MKTSTIILAAVLGLSSISLFAGNESSTASITNETLITSLAPVTPAEATFEEVILVNEFKGLAPVTPSEATFEEMPGIDNSTLAPVTPFEADFE